MKRAAILTGSAGCTGSVRRAGQNDVVDSIGCPGRAKSTVL